MSPLTNHTTGLELSLALKEAGWPQEGSLFYWCEIGQQMPYQETEFSGKYLLRYRDHLRSEFEELRDMAASPTASELMERMPAKIDESYYLQVDKMPSFYCAYYENYADERQGHKIEKRSTHLPDALAKLTLFLVEEGKMRF